MNERTGTRKVQQVSPRHRGRVVTLALVAGVALSLVAGGCGKKEESHVVPVQPPRDPNPSAFQHATLGWEHFSAERYPEAHSEFRQALGFESDNLWALDGLGWTELRLSGRAGTAGMDSIGAAYATFDSALAHLDGWQDAASEADALVGKSMAAAALNDWVGAATAGARASEVGGESYVFRGDHSITVDQPRLVAAEAYIRLQQYEQAYDMLVALDVTVLLRIDPQSQRFVELLIEELQRISLGS